MKLSSAAFLEGFYFKPRIDKELLAAHREGLICLSGCVSSELSRTLLAGGEANMEKAVEIAAWFQKLFGNDYYIEIQNNHLEVQRVAMEGAVQVANRLGIPLVATSDVHYIHREDAEAQDILLCVNTGKFRTDTNRMRMDTQRVLSAQRRGDVCGVSRAWTTPCAARRKSPTASTSSWSWASGIFPSIRRPRARRRRSICANCASSGLERALRRIGPTAMPNGEFSDEVMARLERELGVINKLGFANYFLIVWDFVRFAREQGIQATARGSGVGGRWCPTRCI